MKKNSAILRFLVHTRLMIRFSALGAYLLLTYEGRALIRNGALVRNTALLWFSRKENFAQKSLMFIWKGSRTLMNGHAVPGPFLVRKNRNEIVVAKFEGVIIRLKELCTHMDIIVERVRRRPLFLYNKVWNRQLSN